MGLFDVKGFGETIEEPLKMKPTTQAVFKSSDIDSSITSKINPLVKLEVINKKFNLGKLLKGYGCDMSSSNMYCPFHADEMTGKPSAKYHKDTDTLWCFSESKQYSAYHALKLLYGYDVNKLFYTLWNEMTFDERHEIMSKYDKDGGYSGNHNDEKSIVWEKCKGILGMFKDNKVNYRQYKNALYRVLLDMSKETHSSES